MNFTQNNHLSYSIGDRMFGERTTSIEKFKVNVGKIDHAYYKKSNWLLEQYKTADLIRDEFGKDLVVLFSGGTDSEIVLRAFKHIGLLPRAVFVKFTNGCNEQDLTDAYAIAKDIGLKVEVVECDIEDFYKSGQAAELAGSIQCRQIAYLVVYNQILKMNMPAIMGGEMMLRRHVALDSSSWYYCFRENEDASAMRFSLKYNIPLVNEWFSYTPEMIGYYIQHPDIQRLINTRLNYKLSSMSVKNDILKQLMPTIIEKTKSHGYERLMGFNTETYNTLCHSHPKRLASSLDGIFVDDLITQLFGEEICQ